MSASVNRDLSALCGYALVQRVAQSYLGPLWVAVDQRDESQQGALALVRQLQLPDAASPSERRSILEAAAAARELRHPNILTVLTVLEEGKHIGVVYEHAVAEPLRSMQSWGNMRGLPFPVGVSLRVVIDLLAALESLHRAHSSAAALPSFGGLSPESVLVSRSGETLLCDALVARAAVALEEVGKNPVKLGFTAPEQVQQGEVVTLQSDLFSVGAILWELLTTRRFLLGSRDVIERKLLEGQLPRLADAARGPELPPALIACVDAALATDPAQRPATAHAMAKQLEACGHPVASRQEVAQFVEKLSGQRLERRSASLQALAVVQRGAPASRLHAPESASGPSDSADASIITSAFEPPHSTEAAPPVELDELLAEPTEAMAPLQPESERSSAVEYIEPASSELEELASRNTEIDVAAEASASVVPPSEPTIASVAALAPPARPRRVDTSRTMIGIGLPVVPVPSLEPAPPAPAPPAPAPSPAAPVAAAPPQESPASSSELHAFSLPPPEPLLRSPIGARQHRARRASSARKLAFAVLGAALTLGAVALGIALHSSPPADAQQSAALVAPEAADAPAAAAARPVAEELPAPAPAEPPPAQADAPAADGAERAAETEADAAAEPAPAAPAKTFFVAKLDDAQLAEWFALEQGRDLPECTERLGKRNAAKYTGKQSKLAQARLASAKRALKSGKHDTALTELCAATAHDRSNVEAQRRLAELALNLGDAELAKAAAERGLAATKKKKKKDPELLAVLGDALALLGDIPGSRKAWLETLASGSETQRQKRLVTTYQKAAERSLAGGKLSLARIQLRRVLVLTQASYVPSVDFAQTLLSLDQPRAALAWAERSARALPKNVRAQILLGDAHAANGDSERARAAWRSALKLQPKNAVAAARLRSKRG